MKKLMLTNEAVARGAYEAGVKVVSSYPGTPSTEITEYASKYPEMYTEWAPNEKVAAEVAVGASIAGARAMTCMKHVGLNVAADPIFTAAYTGVNGGLLVVVADDPAMHSSQNEQDSRFYARAAHIPMLEPSDSREAKDFVKLGFEISEKYDTPVFLRLTTRIAHSQSFVETGERDERGLKDYQKDVGKYVMMPAMARGRHLVVESREERLAADANGMRDINRIEMRSKKLGIVCSGAVYTYVKEATDASILKLGMTYPLPMDIIKEFAARVDELMVIEELEPIIETEIKASGIACHGKEIFGRQGEYSVALIREKLYGEVSPKSAHTLPARPPVMCAGCPHRSVFYVINKLKLTVSGDIGCYTLGALAPLSAMDTCVCMGASIGISHGFAKAGAPAAQKMVSVIGDSTFIHSGITGIINAVYNKANITCIILDNSTTGMTGHQQNPATGKTITGEPTAQVDLEALVRACGAGSVRVIDAYDMAEMEKALKEETSKDTVSVIIARRACALLDRRYPPALFIDSEKCRKCKACLKIGCPAIENVGGEIRINPELCVGCGVCKPLCKFGAIQG
ncbi:MAG: indolepyruvate ferredoxin oxidoreductase subunit alpha [Clostridiales bacterium]|nr:indolepyruvate ferredoxin oxidoreductase subunit alpha [Clostridiales bacterium]